MKNTIIACLVLLSFSTLAQKSRSEKIEFNYIQYPTLKLDRSWTYAPEVEQKNINEILEEVKAFTAEIEAIKNQYAEAIERYENYSTAEKLVAGKPKAPDLSKYDPIPYFGEALEVDEVANEYIKIDGFDKTSGDPDFTAKLILNGFTSEGKVDKNKENVVFFHEVFYKNTVSLIVYDKDGKEYINETIDAEVRSKETEKKKSREELERYWKEKEDEFMQALQKEAYDYALKTGAEYINNALGYQEKKEFITFNSAKGKKQSYPKLDEAIENMRRGLVDFGDGNNESAISKINQSIEIWEEVLLEADPDDKKARINGKVASGIHWNCIQAYSILNQFEKANEHLTELKLGGRGSSGSQAEKFMENFKSRTRS